MGFPLLIPRLNRLGAFAVYVVLAALLLLAVCEMCILLYRRFKQFREKALQSRSTSKGEKKSASAHRRKIFISYKRNSEPDDSLARSICQNLEKQHQVFFDQNLPIGTKWAKRIEEELECSDFVVVLLSEDAVQSEMVIAEIETAYRLAKARASDKPKLLPIRVNYDKPFVYPLSAYLNSISWAVWNSHNDTQQVVNQVLAAISEDDSFQHTNDQEFPSERATDTSEIPAPFVFAQPLLLESPEGSIDPSSHFYIRRRTDQLGIDAIHRQGVTITIKGSRQMGKSSLLNQIKQESIQLQKRAIFLDFQLFDKTVLEQPDLFYRQFCSWLSYELKLRDNTQGYWSEPFGNALRCTRYLENYVFPMVQSPIVLAMDEVDRIFDTSFRSDFFGMLRSWHNSRSSNTLWKRLDLALVTSTEPYQFITDLTQSPFNVGEILELKDFDLVQVEDLNERYRSPLLVSEVHALMDLLSGHPYLTRRSLFLVASRQITFSELITTASDDYGPFGEHLRFHYYRMRQNPNQVRALMNVIRNNNCSDLDVYFRLHGAGLVNRNGTYFYPRNNLYLAYFGKIAYE